MSPYGTKTNTHYVGAKRTISKLVLQCAAQLIFTTSTTLNKSAESVLELQIAVAAILHQALHSMSMYNTGKGENYDEGDPKESDLIDNLSARSSFQSKNAILQKAFNLYQVQGLQQLTTLVSEYCKFEPHDEDEPLLLNCSECRDAGYNDNGREVNYEHFLICMNEHKKGREINCGLEPPLRETSDSPPDNTGVAETSGDACAVCETQYNSA